IQNICSFHPNKFVLSPGWDPTWNAGLSSRVTMGILAASLFDALLAQPVSLGGPPCLGSNRKSPRPVELRMDSGVSLKSSLHRRDDC
ncbi:hypothetical protein GOODEAATRI_008120, partial [Goodea atripinnis]